MFEQQLYFYFVSAPNRHHRLRVDQSDDALENDTTPCASHFFRLCLGLNCLFGVVCDCICKKYLCALSPFLCSNHHFWRVGFHPHSVHCGCLSFFSFLFFHWQIKMNLTWLVFNCEQMVQIFLSIQNFPPRIFE